MAEVYVIEIPGSGGDAQAWQCPNCSRAYPMRDEAGRGMECPAKCGRCGAPMDLEKALVFANEQAAVMAGSIKRPTVKV